MYFLTESQRDISCCRKSKLCTNS